MALPKKKANSSNEPSVRDLARELIDDPDEWLKAKNDQLGGQRPIDLLGTPQEPVLRNLLEAIKYGSFS